jgi:hypothetical protein
MSEIKIETASAGGGGGGSGTVTSVSVNLGTAGTDVNRTGSPITTSGTIVINIPVASATNTGKLSNTDWSTFNGKQAALVSGTNIRTVNGNTLLGSTDIAVQAVLVSGTSIKTVLGQSLLGSGAIAMADYLGGPLGNFIPNLTSGVALTIDSSNQDTYCAGVYRVTGAVTITIAGTVRNGFSLTVIQADANACTFAASGGLTLRNRQSHDNSAGQWAVCSLIVSATDLILTGDTA